MVSTCTQAVYILDGQGSTRSTGKNSTFTEVWQTQGYANNVARRAAIIAHASYKPSVTTVDGYLLDNIEWNYSVQQGVLMPVTLTYSHQESARNKSQNPPLQNVNDEETRISFGSFEQKILEAYVTQDPYGVNAPVVGNRIEYDPHTKEVRGTTRKVATSRIQITKVLPDSVVTDAWIAGREEYLFTVNASTWRNREPRTVMFNGLDLAQRSKDGDWHCTFGFQAMRKQSFDLSTLDIGVNGTIDILPYQYPWAYYKDDRDADGNDIPKCQGFYVATNYTTTNFDDIIPT